MWQMVLPSATLCQLLNLSALICHYPLEPGPKAAKGQEIVSITTPPACVNRVFKGHVFKGHDTDILHGPGHDPLSQIK